MASVGEANVMDEVGGKISSCEVSGKRVDNESGIEHIMCTINQRFGAKGVFQKPQQMIYTDSNNKLVIDDTVLSQIGLIDAPLNIVAICGHYRTGKSYLMNVLAEQSCGFALGCTSEGKTKGIWVWCRPHPKQQDQVLILLDTEGQSDIDKGDLEHDNKLFCLTTLLCSTLIYNHKGALDNYILDKLSFIAKMSEHVLFDDRKYTHNVDNVDDSMMRLITPNFILCLRDYQFEVEHKGSPTSAKNKLEQILKERSKNEVNDKTKENVNDKTKECITKYFTKRNCFTMYQPTEFENLKNLDKLDETHLKKDFVEDVRELKKAIYASEPKCLSLTEKPINGSVFQVIAKSFVKSLAEGKTLRYFSAFEQATTHHHSQLVNTLVKEYEQNIMEWHDKFKSKKDLQKKCMDLMEKQIKTFREKAYTSAAEYENEAKTKMEKLKDKKMKQQQECIQNMFRKTLEGSHAALDKTKYDECNGTILYKADIISIEKKFREDMKDYEKDEIQCAIVEFENNLQNEQLRIELASKMKEDKETFGKLRMQMELELKKSNEDVLDKLRKELEQRMKEELERMEKKFNEAMAIDILKEKSFWQRFKMLFWSK